jgi:hypothetical protein
MTYSSSPHVEISVDSGEPQETTPLLSKNLSISTAVDNDIDISIENGLPLTVDQAEASGTSNRAKKRDETLGKGESLERLKRLAWYKRCGNHGI